MLNQQNSKGLSNLLLRVGCFSDFSFVFTIAYLGARYKEKMDSTHKKGWFIPCRESRPF